MDYSMNTFHLLSLCASMCVFSPNDTLVTYEVICSFRTSLQSGSRLSHSADHPSCVVEFGQKIFIVTHNHGQEEEVGARLWSSVIHTLQSHDLSAGSPS